MEEKTLLEKKNIFKIQNCEIVLALAFLFGFLSFITLGIVFSVSIQQEWTVRRYDCTVKNSDYNIIQSLGSNTFNVWWNVSYNKPLELFNNNSTINVQVYNQGEKNTILNIFYKGGTFPCFRDDQKDHFILHWMQDLWRMVLTIVVMFVTGTLSMVAFSYIVFRIVNRYKNK